MTIYLLEKVRMKQQANSYQLAKQIHVECYFKQQASKQSIIALY
jgi:hypothetical protein